MSYERGGQGGNRGGFRGGDRGGFRGGFGGRGGDRGGDRAMYSAVCDSCGKKCEVPFKPTGEKPVYCRDCFAGRAAMGGERSSRPDPRGSSGASHGGGSDSVTKQLELVNVKLEKLILIMQDISDAAVEADEAIAEEEVAEEVVEAAPKKAKKAKKE